MKDMLRRLVFIMYANAGDFMVSAVTVCIVLSPIVFLWLWAYFKSLWQPFATVVVMNAVLLGGTVLEIMLSAVVLGVMDDLMEVSEEEERFEREYLEKKKNEDDED